MTYLTVSKRLEREGGRGARSLYAWLLLHFLIFAFAVVTQLLEYSSHISSLACMYACEEEKCACQADHGWGGEEATRRHGSGISARGMLGYALLRSGVFGCMGRRENDLAVQVTTTG